MGELPNNEDTVIWNSDNRINKPSPQTPSFNSGVVIPVGASRGRGYKKNNIELINSLEYKSLRKPGIASLKSVTGLSSTAHDDDQESGVLNEDKKLENDLSSLSVDSNAASDNKSIDGAESASDKGTGLKNGLNPNAVEFVPSKSKGHFVNNDVSTEKKSLIKIINPKTGLPVILDDGSSTREEGMHNDCSVPCYNDSDLNLDKMVNEALSAALENNNGSQSCCVNVKEVHCVLDLIESLLLCNPGLYSNVMVAMTDIFDRWSKSNEMLVVVANKLMKQSTAMNNYSYIGAKVCTELDKRPFSELPHNSFRGYILSECESEYEKLRGVLGGDNYREAYGVITFFAELYIQLTVKSKSDDIFVESRIKMLGNSLLDSLNFLLLEPTNSGTNISCLCRILKLSGWALDEDHPEKMKRLLDSLLAVRDSNRLDSSTVSMLNNIIGLAKSHWGRNTHSPVVSASATNNDRGDTNANGYRQPEQTDNFDTTEYPGSGSITEVVLSEEEIAFINENYNFEDEYEGTPSDCDYDGDDGVNSDNMDEEAYEAYEQFLLTVSNSNTNNIKK